MKKKIFKSILILFSVVCLVLVYDLLHFNEMKKYTDFKTSQSYLKIYQTFMSEEKFGGFVDGLVRETNDVISLNNIMFFLKENDECLICKNLQYKCDELEQIPKDSVWIQKISNTYKFP